MFFLGDSYSSLQYLYRIPNNTISIIVPKMCSAIYKVLKDDFLSVRFKNIQVTKYKQHAIKCISKM